MKKKSKNFKHGDKVKITKGFFSGMIGELTGYYISGKRTVFSFETKKELAVGETRLVYGIALKNQMEKV